MTRQIGRASRALFAAALLVCAARQTANAQGLPAPWSSGDVGAPAIAGSTTHNSGVFRVDASGRDIWEASDQFRFVYQAATGDVEITARIASLTNTDPWTKVGVMIRESLTADSRHAMMANTAANGLWFGRRPQPAGMSISTKNAAVTSPTWVRVKRAGDTFTAYWSADGATWNALAADTIPMGPTVYVGLAVTSHNNAALATANFDNVNVALAAGNQSPAVTLTQPVNGTQVTAPATLTLAATASDPENRMARVDFYVEGAMIASDTSSPYSASWSASAAGTYSLSAMAYDADGGSSASGAATVTVVNPPNGAPTVSLTNPSNGATFTAPASISLAANASDPEGQLARVEFYSGSTLLGSDTSSPYTFTWSNVAAGTYSLTARAFDSAGLSTTSAAVSVTVNLAPASGLPAGQTAADVGSPAVTGQTTYSSGTYTVSAGGRDIWEAADEFHFVYQAVAGNTEVIARVASIGNTDPWAKAGVMVRETLTGGSRHAMMATTPANGAWFGRRLQTGGLSTSTKDPSGTPPAWVRLVRTGDVFQAYRSTDGANWILVGSDTIPMATTVYVGLAAASHNTSMATTVSFGNLSISTPSGNQPPSVSLTSPANGATFTAPATISISANASDPENQLSRVEYYSGSTLLGTDTAAPFSFTWSNVAAGTYALTARAYDSAGASATSAAVNITVNAANAPPTVSLTSPASGATFTAPATISISASASDPENQLARVEFYSGSTLLGTDTAAPFSFTWSSVAAGTYSLTARAYDAAGATANSAAVSVVVSPASSGAPDTVIFTASADHATNVTSYLLSVYNQGADPATATPVATSDLGKPAPAANNDITVDRTAFFNALATGSYVATVTAIGPGGQTRSLSVTFTR